MEQFEGSAVCLDGPRSLRPTKPSPSLAEKVGDDLVEPVPFYALVDSAEPYSEGL